MKTEIEQVAWNVAAGISGGAARHIRPALLDPKKKWPSLVTGSIIGCICAVFITPLVSKILGMSSDPDKVTGLAFLLGVLGMEGVDWMIRRLRKMLGIEEEGSK